MFVIQDAANTPPEASERKEHECESNCGQSSIEQPRKKTENCFKKNRVRLRGNDTKLKT